MKLLTFKTTHIVLFLAVLTVNYISNAWPLNGLTQKDISVMFPSEFTPAGATFSIWGIIYVLWGAVLVRFLSAKEGSLAAQNLYRLSPVFWLNAVCNMVWLVAWHYLYTGFSVVLMVVILVSLVYLNTVISHKLDAETPYRGLLKALFGVYLGWICIALIANVAVFLVALGWTAWHFSPIFWTGGLIGIGATVAALVVWQLRNGFIGAAVVWALAGIILKQYQAHVAFTAISWAALTWSMPVIAAMFYAQTFKKNRVLTV